jgi:hypothetical protein
VCSQLRFLQQHHPDQHHPQIAANVSCFFITLQFFFTTIRLSLYVLLVQEYEFVVEFVLQLQIVKNRKSFLSVNGTGVNYGSLEAGMKYLLAVLDMSGVGSKLVQDLSIYWWILLLTFLLAFLLSLVWIGEPSCDSCFWSG